MQIERVNAMEKPKTYCVVIPDTSIKLVCVGRQIPLDGKYTYKGVFYSIIDNKVHYYANDEVSPLSLKPPKISKDTPNRMTASWKLENNVCGRLRANKEYKDHIKFIIKNENTNKTVKMPLDKQYKNRNTKPYLNFYYDGIRAGAPDELTKSILKKERKRCLTELESLSFLSKITNDDEEEEEEEDNYIKPVSPELTMTVTNDDNDNEESKEDLEENYNNETANAIDNLLSILNE